MNALRISATMRIAIGLAFISATILVGAVLCGMLPDPRGEAIKSRLRLCEAVAFSVSVHAADYEFERMKAVVRSAVRRNDDILSGGVRSAGSALMFEVGDHDTQWQAGWSDSDLDEQVAVPIISAQDERWGTLEFRFRPFMQPGWRGYLHHPLVRLMIVIPSATLLLSFIYLRGMLQHLDPSKAVPGHVKSALDTLAEGLLVLDRNDRIVFANQVFASWLDVDGDGLVGKRAAQLPWSTPQKESQTSYPWTVALETGSPQVGSVLHLPGEGGRGRALVVNAAPVLGHRGTHNGVLATFEDVTELEAQRAELSEAKEAAEEANQAKTDFLARMSHEIRTPMNAILGFADVLRRGMDQSRNDRQSYVETIHSSGEHLLALINDILDLSKIESGRMELERTACSPHNLLSQIVSVMAVPAREKGIYLKLEWNGQAPESITTDEVRFRQSVMNLVSNAIKFTEEGGVTIRARLDPRRQKLVVEVEDTGVGIAAESLEKVFEPFTQADTSVTRRFGGTGLGLAICRQLAEAMGGAVSVRSELGRGSTFTLQLETGSLKGIKMVDPDTVGESSTRDDTAQPTQLPPARVLVVDDSEVNRDLVTLILTRAGLTVDCVANGQEAVESVIGGTYDLVLMDMQMPVMDGYAATKRLREAGVEIPVVALTAHAMQGDEAKCMEAGCSAFLTKPLQMDLVLSLLQELLRPAVAGRGLPRELEAGSPASAKEMSDDEHFSKQTQAEDDLAESVDGLLDMTASACRPETVTASAYETAWSDPTSEDSPEMSESLTSLLPLEDPDFLAIVIKFKERLDRDIPAMRQAVRAKKLAEVETLAHTLKGSGGSAGFPAFTRPAAHLEQLAKDGQIDQMEITVDVLDELRQRITLPSTTAAT